MKENNSAEMINRVLLGLLMLVPGLLKLFVMKPAAVQGMLEGIGFPAAAFFAWVLILSEIVFGIAILANWKLNLTVIPPIIIMLVAAFTTALKLGDLQASNWPGFIMHIALASNYWLLSANSK